MCEHTILTVGLIRNTRHYSKVRRQTIQLIMSCNVFIISSLPFPCLAKLSNLTSQPYFRFRAAQNLKIDQSYIEFSQVEHLSNEPSSALLFMDNTGKKRVVLSCLFPLNNLWTNERTFVKFGMNIMALKPSHHHTLQFSVIHNAEHTATCRALAFLWQWIFEKYASICGNFASRM
jgi:hypothetical protein